jgi:pimeloyl-ACP methyl ester carboxylesterase
MARGSSRDAEGHAADRAPAEGPVTASRLDDGLLETHPLGKGPLFLRRHQSAGHTGKPVLLLHGASAASDTFLAPENASIYGYLLANGFDPWLLDWRASFKVTEAKPAQANANIDEAVADLPGAIAFVRDVRRREGTDRPISVVAHCMGSACFAMAIGARLVTPDSGIDKIVLSTVGLFFSVTWDGWMKVMDRVLERVRVQDPGCINIHPGKPPWPRAMEEVFRMWPKTWGPPEHWDEDFFRRLAFMYGQPFLVSNLHPTMTPDAIRAQFGAIPFEFYRHAAQNALRGFAIECDGEGKVPAHAPNEAIPAVLAGKYLNLDAFSGLSILLLTGEQNPLWHRDSIDLMFDWLSRNPRCQVKKIVLDGYGHQDLWWGKNSAADVYPRVRDAIR